MSNRKTVKIEDLPGNSFKKRAAESVVQPIQTKGSVSKRKQTFGEKVAKSFAGGSSDTDIGGYIVQDILIPTTKKLLYEIVTGGLSMFLYDGKKPVGDSSSRFDRRGPGAFWSGPNMSRDRDPRPEISRQSRTLHNFDTVEFDYREDAESVLLGMERMIEEYGTVRVSDFFDLIGMTGSYVDRTWGWTNLESSVILATHGGKWIIQFPRTTHLR